MLLASDAYPPWGESSSGLGGEESDPIHVSSTSRGSQKSTVVGLLLTHYKRRLLKMFKFVVRVSNDEINHGLGLVLNNLLPSPFTFAIL